MTKAQNGGVCFLWLQCEAAELVSPQAPQYTAIGPQCDVDDDISIWYLFPFGIRTKTVLRATLYVARQARLKQGTAVIVRDYPRLNDTQGRGDAWRLLASSKEQPTRGGGCILF